MYLTFVPLQAELIELELLAKPAISSVLKYTEKVSRKLGPGLQNNLEL